MESFIILLIIAGIIVYGYSRSSPSKKGSNSTAQKSKESKNEIPEWLMERWKLAESHEKEGNRDVFPSWYFDPATDKQKNRLKEEGFNVPKDLTKGKASDLIGLDLPAEDEHLRILKYFKVSTKGMNETKAKHEVANLFQDPENVETWKSRPPTQLQREEAKFFGVKLPKGTTEEQAWKLITEHQKELDENDPKLEEWESIECVIDELTDADNLKEIYEIKKPSIKLIINALENLKEEGQSFKESEKDIDTVVDKLLEIKPDLQRN